MTRINVNKKSGGKKFIAEIYGALQGFVSGNTLNILVNADTPQKKLADVLRNIAEVIDSGRTFEDKETDEGKTDDEIEDDPLYRGDKNEPGDWWKPGQSGRD